MTRRALVTGAEGFVGTHLRARLTRAGYEVYSGATIADGSIPASRAFDLRDDVSVDALVKWASPLDCILHLAAITFVPDSEFDPLRVMDVNLLGTIRVLDAVKRHVPRARVLYVGSSEAYGTPRTLPITENHALAPANPYAVSKAAADHYCAYTCRSAGLDIVRVRPFNHSGPGQSDAFVLSSFARQIAEMEAGRREHVLNTGNLAVSRDFTHVSDVVEAYLTLLESGKTGDAYNVCSGDAAPLQDIVDRLRSMSRIDIDVRTDPKRLRASYIPEIRGSHEKISAETGWEPQHNVERILQDLLDYWRNALPVHSASSG